LKDKNQLPDLIVIDGGKGQLSAAKSSLDKLGLGYIKIIGLAKKLEQVYIHALIQSHLFL
jgi:excinuclease ABC subunit C